MRIFLSAMIAAAIGGAAAFAACVFVLWGLPSEEWSWQAVRYIVLSGAILGGVYSWWQP